MARRLLKGKSFVRLLLSVPNRTDTLEVGIGVEDSLKSAQGVVVCHLDPFTLAEEGFLPNF